MENSLSKDKEVKHYDETEEENNPVAAFSLFRYSSRMDRILIFIGCISAIIAGLGYPIFDILLGNVIELFVENSILQNATNIGQATNDTVHASEELLEAITHFCVYIIVLCTVMFLLHLIAVSAFNIAAANQAFRIQCLFMKSTLHQNIGWFDRNQTGDFASLITGNLSCVQNGIGQNVGIFISSISEIVFALITAICFGWKLSLTVIFIMLVILVFITIVSKYQAKASAREKETYGIASAVTEEVMSSIRTVAAFGGENKEIERYNSHITETKTQGIKRSLVTSIGDSMVWSSVFLSCAVTLWYGAKLVAEGRIENSFEYRVKDLTIIFFNIISCALGFGLIMPHVEAFSIARGAAVKLFKVIEKISPIDSRSNEGKILTSIRGDIVLNNVNFVYPSRPDVNVLHDFSLTIRSGETVALVGSSGSGKSTIIQLIQRFYDVDEGNVQIDQNDIKDLNIAWLRDNIAVVDQEPVLFTATIADNICYGNKKATQFDIEKAAETASVHDFIMNLPKGYDTVIRNGGTQLSIGQKQRIAIARAIVKNSKILLLDEATSALDKENEFIVHKAVEKVRKNKTTIIVTHQLSIIQSVDRIVTIEDGKIKEIGTHDELMANRNLYYNLFTTQNRFENQISNPENSLNVSNSVLNNSVQQVDTTKNSIQNFCPPSVDHSKNVKKNNVKSSDWRLLKISLPELPYVTVGSICAIIAGMGPALYAILFGEILQLLSQNDSKIMADISYYSLLFIGVAIGSGISTFLQIFLFSIAGEQLTLRLRKMLFANIIYQDMTWFDLPENSVGALCSRLSSDTSDVQTAGGTRISVILQALSALVSTTVIVFYYKWQLGVVAFPAIPLLLSITYLENFIIHKHTLSYKCAVDDASKIATEAVVNIKTVASLNQEDTFYTQFKTALLKPLKESIAISVIRGVVFGLGMCIPILLYIVTFYYGSIYVTHKEMAYGDLCKVIESVIVGSTMICLAVAFTPDYQKAKTSVDRVFQLLDQSPKRDILSDEKYDLANWKGDIEYDSVCFNYPSRPNIEILKGFNLTIEPGKTVALVGNSGCGKTTCLQLIEKFYDATRGALIADDKKFQFLQVSTVRSKISLVSQEPVLFGYSLAENIAYGDNNRRVSFEEIITAARNANIHDFISALPQGYSTMLGDKGTQLSGGQKQRIAIARALIRNPKLLILDEATSYLDAENEKIVQAALDKACKDRTCFVISHRLNAIQNADVIVVVKDGRAVEKGTHDELLQLQGHYYKLYYSQDAKKHQAKNTIAL